MKKITTLLLSIILANAAQAQSPDWLWAKGMSGALSEVIGKSIAIDPARGDVYTTGNFYATADFDPGAGTFNLTPVGIRDVFISKLDSSGNFVWAKAMGGAGWNEGLSIAIDAGSGAVYTTGYFNGTVDFDPDSSGSFNLTSTGVEDIFISKLDASGNFVWAKAMGGTDLDKGSSIAIEPGSGNIYTTGWFLGTADFDPDSSGIFNLTSGVYHDIFISKLDSSGNFVWTKQLDGTGGPNQGNSIAFDPAGGGAIYTTGGFSGITDFDPGAGVFSLTPAHWEIFISKLDTSGNFVWAKAMGGTNAEVSNSIAIDTGGSGAIYTTGNFYDIADFDPGPGVFNLSPAGSWDLFISKLDSSGNFVWAKRIGGFADDYGNSIAVDPSGNGAVYTTGNFKGTVDFDPGLGVYNLTSAGDWDIFISKLDASGNFVWTKAMGGTDWDYGNSITGDASGNMHVTGSTSSPSLTFGSTTLTNASTFIAKLDTMTTITGNNEIGNFDKNILLSPNPLSNSTTISFSLSQTQIVSLKIFDVNGRLVATLADKMFEAGKSELVWNAADVISGVYILQFQSGGNLETKKLIVTK